jgi:hypothetical protein
MKKFVVLYIGVILGIFTSCINEKGVRKIGYHHIANTTGKKIVHEVICNPYFTGTGKDTFQFFSNGESMQMELEWAIEATFYYSENHVSQYWDTYIYCIDDTISTHWEGLWNNENLSNETFCSQYFCFVEKDTETTENEFIYTREYYLTVNDSLLLTMQKDYSMLGKFKEYYAE